MSTTANDNGRAHKNAQRENIWLAAGRLNEIRCEVQPLRCGQSCVCLCVLHTRVQDLQCTALRAHGFNTRDLQSVFPRVSAHVSARCYALSASSRAHNETIITCRYNYESFGDEDRHEVPPLVSPKGNHRK